MGSGAALLVTVAVLAAALRMTGASGSSSVLDSSTALGAARPTAAAPATPTSPPVAIDPGATSAQPVATQPSAADPTAAPTSSAPAVLFTTWRYYNSSFQVYPGPLTPEAQQAIAGFDLTTADQGDSVLLTFKALSSRYHDATVTVPKGQTAYFIETSMRDDDNNQDSELNDDGVVLVDANGYVVQS